MIPGDRFVVNFKTNSFPNENFWKILDANGDEVMSMSNFEANTDYKDTIDLPWGCYTFILEDTDKDGLSFWANNDGSGYIRFRRAEAASIFKTFNGDFGTRLVVPFTLGGSLGIEQNSIEEDFLFVYPNPAQERIFVQAQLNDAQNVELEILSLSGHLVYSKSLIGVKEINQDISLQPFAKGVYFLHLKGEKTNQVRKIVVN